MLKFLRTMLFRKIKSPVVPKRWILCHPDATFPLKATEGAAGFDLKSIENVVIFSGNRAWIRTGLAVEFDLEWVGQIWPRSGLAGRGIDTSAGVIDSDYSGEIKVLVLNNSHQEFVILPGDRIAQLIFVQIPVESRDGDLVVRGSNGFGSTGIR